VECLRDADDVFCHLDKYQMTLVRLQGKLRVPPVVDNRQEVLVIWSAYLQRSAMLRRQLASAEPLGCIGEGVQAMV
jgi:hypothetical protein